METLLLGESKVVIDAGELVSFQVNQFEIIHQKGSPGWRNSDTEMFPVIGPTSQPHNRVQVPKGNAIQDQHGLLRELDYSLKDKSNTKATYFKTYKAGTVINNSKFPDKSESPLLIWPYNFTFEKSFSLEENRLEITFTIKGDRDMPYMLGYHPAFKIHTNDPVLVENGKRISLSEVIAVGSRAMEIPNSHEISLLDKYEITLTTEGFRHFMLWTEVPNMICIEPISFYPYALPQAQLHEGFDYLNGDDVVFKVAITLKDKNDS